MSLKSTVSSFQGLLFTSLDINRITEEFRWDSLFLKGSETIKILNRRQILKRFYNKWQNKRKKHCKEWKLEDQEWNQKFRKQRYDWIRFNCRFILFEKEIKKTWILINFFQLTDFHLLNSRIFSSWSLRCYDLRLKGSQSLRKQNSLIRLRKSSLFRKYFISLWKQSALVFYSLNLRSRYPEVYDLIYSKHSLYFSCWLKNQRCGLWSSLHGFYAKTSPSVLRFYVYVTTCLLVL